MRIIPRQTIHGHQISRLPWLSILWLAIILGLAPVTTPAAGTRNRVTAGEVRVLADRDYYHSLMQAIGDARQRIDLVMFLFKVTDSPKNRPAKLIAELVRAGKRGVAVTVLLERSGYNDSINQANERVAARLRQHGITVLFDSPNTTTHAKMVIIDSRWVFVGSHNLTDSALGRNHEFSLKLDSPALARQARQYLLRLQR